jgi:hypothetical protein
VIDQIISHYRIVDQGRAPHSQPPEHRTGATYLPFWLRRGTCTALRPMIEVDLPASGQLTAAWENVARL